MQVRFFMDKEDERLFCQHVIESGDVLVDRHGKEMPLGEIADDDFYHLYIASHESNLYVRKSGFLDDVRSDVIQFVRCKLKNDEEMDYGRLWFESIYYDDTFTDKFVKEEWIKKKYNKYARWIKKNYLINTDKDFYIAPGANDKYKSSQIRPMATPVTAVEF